MQMCFFLKCFYNIIHIHIYYEQLSTEQHKLPADDAGN